MGMETPRREGTRVLPMAVRLVLMLACFGAVPAFAGATLAKVGGWELEQGVESLGYVVNGPVSTNLNIDSVVLACEEAGGRRVLQLQIYQSTEGPLLPKGVEAGLLKDDPRAEIAIDGRVFPVDILFADVYAVLADATEGMFPRLSEGLVDAIATGRTMVLRFDLVTERAGQPAAFDGEAVIALQAGAGGSVISAVRRCTGTGDLSAAAAHATH